MMLSNITKLEIKIGERAYQLFCAVDSPIGEVHDALCSMKGFVIQKIQEAQNKEEASKEPDIKA